MRGGSGVGSLTDEDGIIDGRSPPVQKNMAEKIGQRQMTAFMLADQKIF